MKRLAVVVVYLLVGCSSQSVDRVYQRNDLQLLTAHAAKEMCSCVFVYGRDDDFCSAWVKAAPDLKTLNVDHDAKTVEAQAVLFWGARAHFVDARRGCILE